MICLGIESTAHTFGIGLANEKEILSDARDVYVPEPGKGIIPRETANHHSEICAHVLKKALKGSKLGLADVDVIAFSRGPGLPPCLRVGATFARALSLRLSKPLVDVNHAVAHIEIGKFTTGAKDPVVVYVSGGNTQILALVGKRYRIFGETLDIPIGNALDHFGREAGLPSPGGPAIEKQAQGGKYIELPYVVKGMDLSFAGIVTAALRKLKAGVKLSDICFSLQETCFAMLTEVTERALAHTAKEEVLLVGGVAANKRFAQMMRIMAKERGARVYIVPKKYSGDNGAMIAWTGLQAFRKGCKLSVEDSKINRFWRADEVEITW